MPAEWEAVWTTMKDSFGRDEMDVLETAERKKWVTLPDGGSISGLAGMFNKSQCNPTLKPVMQAIHGLMRLLPSNRITIDEALDFVGQANNDGAPPSHTDHCWSINRETSPTPKAGGAIFYFVRPFTRETVLYWWLFIVSNIRVVSYQNMRELANFTPELGGAYSRTTEQHLMQPQ